MTIAQVDDVIRKNETLFDSIETIAVRPWAERDNKGQLDWSRPYIQVIARRPKLLKLPALLEGLVIKVVVASLDEQAERVLAARKAIAQLIASTADFPSAWRTGVLEVAENTLLEARNYSRLTYVPLKPTRLVSVDEEMEVIVLVSPDAGWRELRKHLSQGQNYSVAMYDFTAPHIADALLATVKLPGGRLKMVLGPNESLPKPDDLKSTKINDRSESDIRDQFELQIGSRFDFCWASVGIKRQFPSSYHIKVAVKDSKSFWLSSGNWQSSNQPEEDFAGDADGAPTNASEMARFNREWHVIVKNEGLSEIFETYIEKDYDTASEEGVTEGAIESTNGGVLGPDVPPGDEEFTLEMRVQDDPALAIEEAPRRPRTAFAPTTLERKTRKVQPILTPDNYADHVLPFIEGATNRLWFQNQSLSIIENTSESYRALLDALKAKSWELTDCRIIFRDFIRVQTIDQLKRLRRDGFNMDVVRVMQNCHTKGILVDSRFALVGSHNWTNEGTTYNRDASLLFDDTEVAEYYEKVMDHDWKHLAVSIPVDTETAVAVIPMPGEVVEGERAVFNPRAEDTRDD